MIFIGFSYLPLVVAHGNQNYPENNIYTLQVFYIYLFMCTVFTITFIGLNFYQEYWARKHGMIYKDFKEFARGKAHCIKCNNLIKVSASLIMCPNCGYEFGKE